MNLQEEIKALKVDEQEFPQKGDTYWCVVDGLLSNWSIYEDDYIDRGRKQSGNFFRTREQAEFAAEKLRVEAELRKLGKHFENGKSNIEFYYDHEFDGIMLNSMKSSQTQGAIYFESEEKAKQATQAVGEERIKK